MGPRGAGRGARKRCITPHPPLVLGPAVVWPCASQVCVDEASRSTLPTHAPRGDGNARGTAKGFRVRGGSSPDRLCSRVLCIRTHRKVSYGGAKVVFGQYEQLAPPPEVFGGSIPSHWPIIMM